MGSTKSLDQYSEYVHTKYTGADYIHLVDHLPDFVRYEKQFYFDTRTEPKEETLLETLKKYYADHPCSDSWETV